MAYEIMYEGDGFIRKGPKPKKLAGIDEQASAAAHVENAAEKTKPVRRRGGITPFRLTRLIFG